MNDRCPCSFQAGKAGFDQVAAGLGQNLDHDVIGYLAGFDETADEIEIGGTGGREADFNLLDPDLDQQIEKALFLLRIHRVDQSLVAVAQVGGQPAWCLVYGARWPLPVGQVYLRKRAIFL